MRLTREMLHPNGCSHTRAQMEALGVQWPPEKGWLSRLVGTEISEDRYAEFVRLGSHSRREQKRLKPAKRPPREHAELFHTEEPADFANELFEKTGRDLS